MAHSHPSLSHPLRSEFRRSKSLARTLALPLGLLLPTLAPSLSSAAPPAAPAARPPSVIRGTPRLVIAEPNQLLSPAAPHLLPAEATDRLLAELRRTSPQLVPAELTAPEVMETAPGHVVRYRQLHHGLPVLGGELVLRVAEGGAIVRLARDVIEAEALARISPQPKLSAEAARKVVRELQRGDTAEPQLAVDRDSLRLVYVVAAIDVQRFENALYLVDAQTGALVRRIERLQYAAAQFKAFQPNPVVSMTPSSRPIPGGETGKFAPRSGTGKPLESELLRAYNCVDEATTRNTVGIPLHLCELRQTAAADGSGNFDGYTPLVNAEDGKCVKKADANRNTFAEQHMYFHMASVYQRFRDLFAGLGQGDFKLRMSMGASPQPFPMVVNLCMPNTGNLTEAADPTKPLYNFENAFFSPGDVGGGFSRVLLGQNGDIIAFGMGGKANYALDGDVVYHEFTHAVVNTLGRLSDPVVRDSLGIRDDAGAMNEGLADFFSSGLAGDPGVGEYAQKNFPMLTGKGLRNLENSWQCADDRVGEIHEDSRAISGALWEARKQVAGEPLDASPQARQKRDRFDQAVLAALAGSGATPSMTEMAQAVVQELTLRATDLGADAAMKTTAAFTAHGVLPACNRVIKKLAVKRVLCIDGDGSNLTPGHVQWRVEVPGNADTIQIRLEAPEMGGCTQTAGAPMAAKLQLAVRKGDQPVEWDQATGKVTADQVIDLAQTGTMWAASVPKLRGVQHVMIVNSGGGTIGRNITLTTACSSPQGCDNLDPPDLARPEGPGTADGGTGSGGEGGGGGCSCEVGAVPKTATRTAGGAIIVILAAVGLRRRRARRS